MKCFDSLYGRPSVIYFWGYFTPRNLRFLLVWQRNSLFLYPLSVCLFLFFSLSPTSGFPALFHTVSFFFLSFFFLLLFLSLRLLPHSRVGFFLHLIHSSRFLFLFFSVLNLCFNCAILGQTDVDIKPKIPLFLSFFFLFVFLMWRANLLRQIPTMRLPS